MATGGCLIESDIPKIYSCPVCLEHLLNRNPRFLSCHHYFCQQCLQKLTKRGQVSCPTCRRVTTVANNDVTKLTMNFPLVQIMEREHQVMEREQHLQQERERNKREIFAREKQQNCSFCNQEESVFKCEECNQILCEACRVKHDKMKTFKTHNIIKLCDVHLVGISHICLKCVKELCVKCVVLEHSEHEDKVEEYTEQGAESLKCDLRQMEKALHERMEAIERCQNEVDIKKNDVLKERRELQWKREDLMKQVVEIDNKLHDVAVRESTLDDDFKLYTELKEKCAFACRNVNELEQSSVRQILSSFLEQKLSVEEVMSETDKLGIKINDDLKETTEWLRRPVKEAVYDKFGRYQISFPTSIKVIDKDLYVYSDYSTRKFVVFDDKGEVRSFKGHKEHGEVKCVDIYNNCLYLVQGKRIMYVANFNTRTEKTLFFKPNINNICKIAVASANVLYCTDIELGQVYEYNTEDDATKTVLEGLKRPSYISVDHTPQGTRCILSLGDSWTDEQSVNIYNRSWELLATIKQDINEPRDTAPCPGGFLLADRQNNKINLYSYKGELLRTVLTKHSGIARPYSLTFRYPYLWVAQGYQGSGKLLCFRVVK